LLWAAKAGAESGRFREWGSAPAEQRANGSGLPGSPKSAVNAGRRLLQKLLKLPFQRAFAARLLSAAHDKLCGPLITECDDGHTRLIGKEEFADAVTTEVRERDMLRRNGEDSKASGYAGWGLGIIVLTCVVVVAALGAFMQ